MDRTTPAGARMPERWAKAAAGRGVAALEPARQVADPACMRPFPLVAAMAFATLGARPAGSRRRGRRPRAAAQRRRRVRLAAAQARRQPGRPPARAVAPQRSPRAMPRRRSAYACASAAWPGYARGSSYCDCRAIVPSRSGSSAGCRPNSTVTVRLPAALELRTGRYLVRLHVTDPRGRALRRSGAYPGPHADRRAAPEAACVPRPAGAAAPCPRCPAAVARRPRRLPGRRRLRPRRRRRALRRRTHRPRPRGPGHHGRRRHAGRRAVRRHDQPGREFQSGGAGEYVVLDGADGRDYFFAHCLRGSTAVAVRRGGRARTAAVPRRRDRHDERRTAPAFRDLAGRLARPGRRADRPAARTAGMGGALIARA